MNEIRKKLPLRALPSRPPRPGSLTRPPQTRRRSPPASPSDDDPPSPVQDQQNVSIIDIDKHTFDAAPL
jgi:hypothetical protein